jgi:hypothetical protein
MTIEEKTEKNQQIQKATEDIESIVQRCSVVALRKEPVLMQTIKMARGMQALRNVLTESAINGDFMPLQNTALGFLTDKPEGYDWKTVRECVIEGLLRGFRPINNEFNIISGRFYGAKNGFERIVREYPGLRNLAFELGVPVMVADKGALVACEATWELDGEQMALSCQAPPKDGPGMDTRIPVRVNAGMGPDAILGKATRKMFARIYQKLSGCAAEVIEGEPGDGVVIPATALPAPADPSSDGKRISMRNGKKDEGKPVEQQKLVQEEPGADG